MQLRCHTSRTGHLYSKFGWGNKKSLVDDPAKAELNVREELIKHYKCAVLPPQITELRRGGCRRGQPET